MGALGDVIDRWNQFPTPVKILIIGGVGVAGYLGYQHFVAGGGSAAGTSDTPTTLDLAPQGTTDNLSANGGANSTTSGTGTTSTGGGSTSTTTGGTSGSTSAAGGGSSAGTPKTGGDVTVKKPVKKTVAKAKTVAKKAAPKKSGLAALSGATTAAGKHLAMTASTTKHPNIGYSTKANPRPSEKRTAAGPKVGKLN